MNALIREIFLSRNDAIGAMKANILSYLVKLLVRVDK